MMRLRTYIACAAAFGLLTACGKPLETKEEFESAAANAAVPATAAKATGGLLRIYGSYADIPDQLPQPSITVKGENGGEATLSVNPVGVVVGLVGKGVLFDTEYKSYSVDGLNYLDGKVSVLANFDYVAAANEDPNANLQISFVGKLGLSGVVSDETRLNLVVKTNVGDLMTREGTTKLRLNGKVTASEHEFEFADEDVVIDWAALEQQAQQSNR